MGDVTRALVGLEDFEVTGAVETAAGVLEVSVRVARPDAACVRCGTFSSRVKEYRTCRVRDGRSYERPTVWCGRSGGFVARRRAVFGPSPSRPAQVAPRRRVTARLCAAIACAAVDRSTAAVARSFRVGWATAWRAIAAAARGQARPPPGATAATLGHRRDHVPAASQFHDRPRGPRRPPVVGLHRGPLQESAGRPPRSARPRVCTASRRW